MNTSWRNFFFLNDTPDQHFQIRDDYPDETLSAVIWVHIKRVKLTRFVFRMRVM